MRLLGSLGSPRLILPSVLRPLFPRVRVQLLPRLRRPMVPRRSVLDSTTVLLRDGARPPCVFLPAVIFSVISLVLVLAERLLSTQVYSLRGTSLEDGSFAIPLP